MKLSRLSVICLVFIMLFQLVGCINQAPSSSSAYERAVIIFAAGEYMLAASEFAALGDYLDSGNMSRQSKYSLAAKYYDNGDYLGALRLWNALGSWKDSPARLDAAIYGYCDFMIGQNRLDELVGLIEDENLPPDSVYYKTARALEFHGDYFNAIRFLELCGQNPPGAAADLLKMRCLYAVTLIDAGEFVAATEQLDLAPDYDAAKDLKSKIMPQYGRQLMAFGRIAEAAEAFDLIAPSGSEYRTKAAELLEEACGAEGYPKRVIGYLTIDKIGLKDVHIADGTDQATMNKYIAHFPNSSIWSDNISLTAHNRGFAVNYFSRLPELVKGDVIEYRTAFGVRKYIVESYTKIDHMNWSVTYSHGDSRLTLITCVNNRPDLRYCVVAKLAEN